MCTLQTCVSHVFCRSLRTTTVSGLWTTLRKTSLQVGTFSQWFMWVCSPACLLTVFPDTLKYLWSWAATVGGLGWRGYTLRHTGCGLVWKQSKIILPVISFVLDVCRIISFVCVSLLISAVTVWVLCAGQDVVFQCLGESLLDNAFMGYNACIFAYGQTGNISEQQL